VEQVQKLRILLVSQEDADHIASRDPVFEWHDIFHDFVRLPEIKLPRVDLKGVDNYGTFKRRYLSVFTSELTGKLRTGYLGVKKITGLLEKAGKEIPLLHDELSSLHNVLSGLHPWGTRDLDDQFDRLFNFSMTIFDNIHAYQYLYGLLSDLIDTYNEIKELLLHINSECCPGIGSFPKHLLLGKVKETESFRTYRHRFYKSPVFEPENSNRRKLFSLINRFDKMMESYSPDGIKKGIRITPSNVTGETGEKAVPAYYSLDEELLALWSFTKTTNLHERFNLGYHTEVLANVPEVQMPLMFDTGRHDLFRIEGHLGMEVTEARDRILAVRNRYGLDFDCRIIEFEDDAVSFRDFVKDNPSLEFMAGVRPGGTFILISNRGEVVADLCLPYKIVEEKEDHKCIYLKECTYPWISSLKYLNNLSRSLKGTQSRHKDMPEEYLLQVLEYKINGHKLLLRPSTVTIPLQKIYLRRMHVITEALNKRFDKGVVFDFDESRKRFVITSARDDSYTIRFRDVTFGYDSPVYTYSNNGMFRNNRVFRPDAMRCREIKSYDALFYEDLQKKIAPVNKDDDYGRFKKKWAQWNRLKIRLINNKDISAMGLHRLITRSEELPEEIRTTLQQFKNDFNAAAEDDLHFMLDGDWVNGEWVSKKMLDHYRKNMRNSHDDIVLFVKLREFLHSETGVTKLAIYITNREYGHEFDDVIQKYDKFADVYFGSPKGENAIVV
jgi:hypothetical protein